MHSHILIATGVILLTLMGCKSKKKTSQQIGKPSKYEMQGLEYERIGEYTKAIDMFEKGLKKNPSDKSLLNMVSDLYARLGDHSKALQHLNALTYYHPNYATGFFYRGLSEFELMQYEKTILTLDTFLIKPDARKDLKEDAQIIQKNARFAAKALLNAQPITFENMGKNINSKHNEYWPGITVDEEVFIFTRRQNYVENLYISRKKNNEWQNAIPLPGEVNSELNEGTAAVTSDGKYIFYTMCNRKTGYGSCDIYISKLLPGGQFGKAMILPPPLNTPAFEGQPSIAANGRTLYFTSNRAGGYGGMDIWKSEWDGTGFGQPVNLGPEINTPGDEQAPFIHPDGKTLYFSSNGHIETMGGADLYVARFDGEKWGKVTNMGYPINTPGDEFGLIVDRKGETAYFSSERTGGLGGLDIYSFTLPQELKPEPVSYVKGLVYDKITKEPLEAEIELIDLKSGKVISQSKSDKEEGAFLIVLTKGNRYMFNVNKESYLFFSENFDLIDGTSDKPFIIEAPLEKPQKGSTIVLNNVFFDVNQYTLKPESKAELQKVYEFISRFPNYKFEIGGHTDQTGSRANNLTLSAQRANEVKQYLISLGAPKQNLSSKGYADEKPIDTNETEEGRARNRRTEIQILEN